MKSKTRNYLLSQVSLVLDECHKLVSQLSVIVLEEGEVCQEVPDEGEVRQEVLAEVEVCREVPDCAEPSRDDEEGEAECQVLHDVCEVCEDAEQRPDSGQEPPETRGGGNLVIEPN